MTADNHTNLSSGLTVGLSILPQVITAALHRHDPTIKITGLFITGASADHPPHPGYPGRSHMVCLHTSYATSPENYWRGQRKFATAVVHLNQGPYTGSHGVTKVQLVLSPGVRLGSFSQKDRQQRRMHYFEWDSKTMSITEYLPDQTEEIWDRIPYEACRVPGLTPLP